MLYIAGGSQVAAMLVAVLVHNTERGGPVHETISSVNTHSNLS